MVLPKCLLILVASTCTLVFGCNTYTENFLHPTNPFFLDPKAPTDLLNLNQILLLFYWPTNETQTNFLVIQDSGKICNTAPDRFSILDSFGPGFAMVPLQGGFLACGGIKNKQGQCCFWQMNSDECKLCKDMEHQGFTGKIQMANDVKWVGIQHKIVMFKEVSGDMLLGSFKKVGQEFQIAWKILPPPSIPNVLNPIEKACIVMDKTDIYLIGGKDASGATVKNTFKLTAANDKKKGQDWKYFTFPTTARSEAACYFDKHIDRLWVFGGRNARNDMLTTSEYVEMEKIPMEIKETIKWFRGGHSPITVQLDGDYGISSRTYMVDLSKSNEIQLTELIINKGEIFQVQSLSNLSSVTGELASVVVQSYSLDECNQGSLLPNALGQKSGN